MVDNRIRVAARIRPLAPEEEERGEETVVYVQDARTVVAWSPFERDQVARVSTRTSVSDGGIRGDMSEPSSITAFGFDATFDSPADVSHSTLQERMYKEIGHPVLQSALVGISGCLFAYGQTGSGKTFSLFGTKEAQGVLPRLANELMEAKRQAEEENNEEEFSIKASFLELYNENLVDLLSASREPLRLFENSREGVLVPGLSESEVATQEEFATLLEFALRGRSVGETCLNAHSSRSHALIQLRVHRATADRSTRSKIHLIDLAGSERQKRANNEGLRMKEGIHINVSLSALGLVISRLSEIAQGRNHCAVPYRDSKLTFLLKDSLSGNARTQVLIALSPASSSYEESLSSLRFAQSVKRIHTRPVADVMVAGDSPIVQELQAEVERLQAELCSLRSAVDDDAGGCRVALGSPYWSHGTLTPLGMEAVKRLEGTYLSPNKSLIEVSRDGLVRFLNGAGHHPIRIIPAMPGAAGAGSTSNDSLRSPMPRQSVARVRLVSEGDPDYRYVLVAEDEDSLAWRHEDSTISADVRWQRVSGPSMKPTPQAWPTLMAHDAGAVHSSLADSRVARGLRLVQVLSHESRSLGRVAAAVPALVCGFQPSVALEVIEALISLCSQLDEANSLLEHGAADGIDFFAGLEHVCMQATWLAPEANPDMVPCSLLYVKMMHRPCGGVDPEVARLLPVPDFEVHLGELRSSAGLESQQEDPQGFQCRQELRASLRFRPGSLSPAPPGWVTDGLGFDKDGADLLVTPGRSPSPSPFLRRSTSPSLREAVDGSETQGSVPTNLDVLNGRYFSALDDAIQIDTNGVVSVRGRTLQLIRDGDKVVLRDPIDSERRPYTLLGRQPSGALVWKCDDEHEEDKTGGSVKRVLSSDSSELGNSGGGGRGPVTWTPAELCWELGPSTPGFGNKAGAWLWKNGGDQIQLHEVPPTTPVREGFDTKLHSPPLSSLAATPGEDGQRGRMRSPPRGSMVPAVPGQWTASIATPPEAQTSGQAYARSGSAVSHRENGKGPADIEASGVFALDFSSPRRPPAMPSQGIRSGTRTRPTKEPVRRRPRSADPYARPAPRERDRERGRVAGRAPTPTNSGSQRRSQSVSHVRPRLGIAAGNGDPGVVGKNFDKSTMRLRNGSMFVEALARWRATHAKVTTCFPRRVLRGMCTVYVRKRPMSERDARRCDFDVLTVAPEKTMEEDESADIDTSCAHIGPAITHHACMFDKSMVTPFIHHTQFPFDGVFDGEAGNEDVYRIVGRPLLDNAIEGHLATLFVFGQTGSGKTYTMRAVEGMLAEQLFRRLGEGAEVSLTYFELAGKKALDLLTEQKSEIRVREEEDGCFRPQACEEIILSSPEELLRVMGEAASRRATDATFVNSVSSRSHAVCRISILRERRVRGRLLLVDCAGTERSKDTLYFKGNHQKESAEINSSLFALKDCIRFRQAAIHRQGGMPQDGLPLRLPSVRATPLTKILAESLVSATAQLAVIATVSPNATDAEHTMETLRTVYTLSGRGDARVIESRTNVVD